MQGNSRASHFKVRPDAGLVLVSVELMGVIGLW